MSTTLEFSSVANLFPMMSDEEFGALKDDIRQHGQRDPIWVYQGKIIDGRNRYRACAELGIEPITREWEGDGSPVDFVVSLNLHRRHLSSSQKAVIALVVEKQLAKEAKARMTYGVNQHSSPNQKVDEARSQPQAAEQAAKLVGTNRQYISDAKIIRQTAPDLLPIVRDGELTIPEARELSNFSEADRKQVLTDVRAGLPLKDALKTAKQVSRQRRGKRKEERQKSGAAFLTAFLGEERYEDHVAWRDATAWESAVARSYRAIKEAPEFSSAAELIQSWSMKKKLVRLRWVQEIQARLKPIATALELETAGYDGYDDQEINDFLQKEMGEFDPDDF